MVAVVLFFSVTAFVCADSAPADKAEKSIFSNSGSSYPGGPDTKTDDSISNALHRMMAAVIIVILLGVAAVFASKKLLPKISNAQGKKIKVIETIHLGSRKTVHLLEVGGQQILIGSTHDRITKLAEIFSEKGFPLSTSEQNEVTE